MFALQGEIMQYSFAFSYEGNTEYSKENHSVLRFVPLKVSGASRSNTPENKVYP